jgi:transposase-like protein
MLAGFLRVIGILEIKYFNNIVDQDHGFIKHKQNQ